MLGLKTEDKKNNGHKDEEHDERKDEERAQAKGPELETTPVVKVIELIGTSTESFDDALLKGISTAAKSLRHITGADIRHMTVAVKDGKVQQYKVNLKVAFALEPDQDDD